MGPARIATNIVNGNRADAAQAIATAPNPASMTLAVMRYLVDDHDYEWPAAWDTLQSLTNRNEFWEQP